MNEEDMLVKEYSNQERVKGALRGEPIFKLLITLTTSMLGLNIFFGDRVAVEQNAAVYCLAIAPIFFIASIMCSFYILTAIAFFDPEHGRKEWLAGKFELAVLIVSISGFLGGLFCLGVASYLNFIELLNK